ncbi:MAG: Aspartyl/glutamyl-tRNA(Asn/Gln) amidotransferase subunit B [Parcubacteria group bacterium GW2011_GWA2_40_14]|nr:MAG: Aspartyl/glutamyl-tRNA(Asn/Gln) amidotransferase subunit B [Parcubacteria group bacterium GW2011_GWA2_40_14]
MDTYTMTIGLEVHAELSTKSKMFCGCANMPISENFEKFPNVNICPVCMGHPGTLPVINKEAVKKVLLVGTAVGGKIADFTEWDRKNYFYPDIPKGYQISQYKHPLAQGGTLNGVQLTRIHLEEDTARSSHQSRDKSYESTDANSRYSILDTPNSSLLDFNRAGVPLMELVTEPSLHTAEEATHFAKELQFLLQYLDVSDANMEKGEMRIEANISISPIGHIGPMGTKVEVKNINSFRAVGKAIEYEFKRQTELLERGEKVVQETRGWDENKQVTFSQRLKESAHDYRYFPDPDLPKLFISDIPEFSQNELKEFLIELPWEKRARYAKDFGIKEEDIEVYVIQKEVGEFFEEVVKTLGVGDEVTLSPSVGKMIKTASNYITSDLIGLSKSKGIEFTLGSITADTFAKLTILISTGELSSRAGKDILKLMFENGGEPETIAKEKGLIQKNDVEEIKKVIGKILSDNPKVVTEYKGGKTSVLQFLVGQAMKETKGSANPEMLKTIALELLTK